MQTQQKRQVAVFVLVLIMAAGITATGMRSDARSAVRAGVSQAVAQGVVSGVRLVADEPTEAVVEAAPHSDATVARRRPAGTSHGGTAEQVSPPVDRPGRPPHGKAPGHSAGGPGRSTGHPGQAKGHRKAQSPNHRSKAADRSKGSAPGHHGKAKGHSKRR
ncbi:hypothetical protein [Nocardioides sp. SYSU DS0663]|uniref:hypothetical protein n=1 Tax=Nocardioides sp. SYSU DS0663 TaxID=3416445 RepID=UPI003F4B6EAB